MNLWARDEGDAHTQLQRSCSKIVPCRVARRKEHFHVRMGLTEEICKRRAQIGKIMREHVDPFRKSGNALEKRNKNGVS